MRPRVSRSAVLALLLLLGSVAGLQAMRDGTPVAAAPSRVIGAAPYIQSAGFLKHAVLSYDALAADIYWIRAVQEFGSTKLSTDPKKSYDFLYPLLDLTTSLDPDFEVAYRFGAVFLAEEYPGGAGRTDLAIALLEKGLAAHPAKWQYAQDIAFVHYWWRHDYVRAAEWFTRASRLPKAPNWLVPMAAVTLTEGGNRESARRLWTEVSRNAETPWLRDQAYFRLTQLDALDQIDALERVVKMYEARTGELPRTFAEVARAGFLRGIPLDPRGFPYEVNPYWGTVRLAQESTLAPLPRNDEVPK